MLADQLINPFDFDAWMNLAKQNPLEFEENRQLVIEHTLQRYGNTLNLQRLQFRIDAIRFRSRTPIQSYLRLSEIMWDEFFNMNDALNQLGPVSQLGKPTQATTTEKKSATVIPFRHH